MIFPLSCVSIGYNRCCTNCSTLMWISLPSSFRLVYPHYAIARHSLKEKNTAKMNSQFSLSSEDISRANFYEYRTRSFPRSSDIFKISQNRTASAAKSFTGNPPPRVVHRNRVNLRCRPRAYKRHTNLDSRPLKLSEKLNLARLHYVTFPNIARLCCVLFALGWFLFIAYNTLSEYKQHNTTVSINFDKPSTSSIPSITICTQNIFDYFNDSSIPKISALKLLNRDDTTHILSHSRQESSVNNPYLEIHCILVPTAIPSKISQLPPRNCTDLVPAVIHMSEGKRCFTYFSDIYGEMTKASKNNPELILEYDQLPVLKFMIHGQYIYGINWGPNGSKKFSGVYISLNRNDVIPDMTSSAFHQMFPGKVTNIQFVRRVEQLLPPPFHTNCFTYSPEHVPNAKIDQLSSERTYRSRGECLLLCLWKLLNRNCTNMYSIYTTQIVEEEENRQNMEEVMKMLKTGKSLLNQTIDGDVSEFFKVCPKKNDTFLQYKQAKEYCLTACPSSCRTVTYNEDRVYTTDFPKIDGNINSFAVISWASSPEVNLRHRPKWDQADFLAQIGGEFHVMLKISMLQLISYCIKMIESGELFPDTSIAAIIHWFVNAFENK